MSCRVHHGGKVETNGRNLQDLQGPGSDIRSLGEAWRCRTDLFIVRYCDVDMKYREWISSMSLVVTCLERSTE